MPGMRCAVAVCNNNWQNAKKQGIKTSFHRFPKNYNRQTIWSNLCRRKDKWNPNTSYICSEHFSRDAFETDLRSELLPNTPTIRKLKDTAIPTLLLQKVDVHKKQLRNIPQNRLNKKKRKKIAQKLLLNSEEVLRENGIEGEESLKMKYQKIVSDNVNLKDTVQKMQQKMDSQQEEIVNLKKMLQDSCNACLVVVV